MKLEELTKARPGDHCLVCGAPPAVIGIFTPDNPELYGAPAGKTRLIRYCLCEKCRTQPDTPARAEKIMLAELAGGVTNA